MNNLPITNSSNFNIEPAAPRSCSSTQIQNLTANPYKPQTPNRHRLRVRNRKSRHHKPKSVPTVETSFESCLQTNSSLQQDTRHSPFDALSGIRAWVKVS
ncbi:hypothetical protein Droror1_Dr00007859 [Drosera rotundifolia]